VVRLRTFILKTAIVSIILLMIPGCVEPTGDSPTETLPAAILPKAAPGDEVPLVNGPEGPLVATFYLSGHEVPVPRINRYTGTSN